MDGGGSGGTNGAGPARTGGTGPTMVGTGDLLYGSRSRTLSS